MANVLLTPITLWSDFDDSLPTDGRVLREREEGGVLLQAVRFSGRDAGDGRVDAFALFGRPAGEEPCPALLILPDSSLTADEDLVLRFARKGYAVLMPDYRGEWYNCEDYTIYPPSIEYANRAKAGRHIDHADPTAKETTWYEWTALARYCVRYLLERCPDAKVGVIGLKAGGDIAFQLAATSGELACAIPVCAGGWRAYRGLNKFGDTGELKMDDERYRFLAGVDAQAYAQLAKCPVLMLCSTNDENFDADRAFDTFARINPEQEKTFYFAARYNGCIGHTGLNDLDLFIDKYLKRREVFIPTPADIVIEEDGDGELVARVRFDRNGEVTYCEVFMAEENTDSASRDWTLCPFKREEEEGGQIFRLNAYEKASRVFAFAKAKYSCGFAVSSKIAVKRLEKKYVNSTHACRILYSSTEKYDSFVIDRSRENLLADCFLTSDTLPVRLITGPYGIQGIYSSYGLKLFRINDIRFSPIDGALLKFDLYSKEAATITIAVCLQKEGIEERYSCNLRLSGGEIWSAHVLSAKDFKSAENKPLFSFVGAKYLAFSSASEVAINNLLWL